MLIPSIHSPPSLDIQAQLDTAEASYQVAFKERRRLGTPTATAPNGIRTERQLEVDNAVKNLRDNEQAVETARFSYANNPNVSAAAKLPVLDRLKKATEGKVAFAQAGLAYNQKWAVDHPDSENNMRDIQAAQAKLDDANNKLADVNSKIAYYSRPGAA